MNEDLLEMPLEEDIVREDDAAPETVPVPRSLVPHLSETAILLDVDGTLLDLMPTPREVWVPPGLVKTLNRLLVRTNGALALVSGRSLNDIDLIFAPDIFPAVGGHGAEMRIEPDSESVDSHAPPLDKELKRRLAAIAKLSPGILLEDKGYSLARGDNAAPANSPCLPAIFPGSALRSRPAGASIPCPVAAHGRPLTRYPARSASRRRDRLRRGIYRARKSDRYR